MIEYAFVMTVFVLLLGPVKVIPQFARISMGNSPSDKRRLALLGLLFASLICAAVAFLTQSFVVKYQLSIPAIQLAGGLILLLSALNGIFPKRDAAAAEPSDVPVGQKALAPLASPVIVTPAGIAAIMIFVLLAGDDSAQFALVAQALVIVMLMNLAVMLFNDLILKIPGIMVALQLASTVLLVVQTALSFQVLIFALGRLGFIQIA